MIAMALLVAACLVWVCAFKIFDRDFWWHVTAGKVMWQTGSLIQIDPFAYTREGMAYLATHEWMAQLVLFGVMDWFGVNGIIVFRTVMCILTFGLLLCISPRRIWPLGFLAVYAANMVRGGFLERPQLFTFVIFAAMLLLACRFLETENWRRKVWLCVTFCVLELLWVNMHGGAALLGIVLIGCVFLQRMADAIRGEWDAKKDALLLCGTGVLFGIIFILPPNGFESISYVWNLLHDQTIAFIAEWQPREWGLYLLEITPFWLMAIAAIIIGRRRWIFCTVLLLATGYLSRQAFRHETLFVMATLAIIFYQAGQSARFDPLWHWVSALKWRAPVMTVLILAILLPAVQVRGYNFRRHDNLFGYGAFDLAKGATDFLESEKIGGNMFNTYGIGGYLIYRGYPDRKVFIDGRNVDFGFDFMARTYAAGVNAERWKELEDTYQLNYALVDYDVIRLEDHIPYSMHLDTNPDWRVVYVDDWVAVYLKNTPENAEVIKKYAYTYLTPTNLQFHSDFSFVPKDKRPELAQELARAIESSPQSIKARLILAGLLLQTEQPEQAEALAHDALTVRPRSPEPYGVLAALAVKQEDWKKAADMYGTAIKLAGDEYKNINYGFVAMVYENAGNTRKAAYYRRLADKGAAADPLAVSGASVAGGSAQSGSGLMVNPAADALEFNDQAITLAEEGKYTEARDMFLNALKLNPVLSEAWNNLCALDLSLERYDDARTECTRALEEQPDYVDALYNLAIVQMYQGQLSEALTTAKKAEKLGHDISALVAAINARRSQQSP